MDILSEHQKMMHNRTTARTEGKIRLSQRGVTLIELLVTLTIIGVLTAIITPIYINTADSARRTKCAHQLRQLGDTVLAYEFEYGVLPGPVGPLGLGKSSKVYTLEDYLIEAGYPVNDEMWICPSNSDIRNGGQVAERSSYTINNFGTTEPAYFFGIPLKPRALSLSVIQSNNSNGVWLLRDDDIYEPSSSYDPRQSPGIGENKPPHAKGRNYYFADGHVKHYKKGAFPPDGKEGKGEGHGGSGGDGVLLKL